MSLENGDAVVQVGHYAWSNMLNIGQTALLFELPTGQTNNAKGDKTIWIKLLKLAWINDRQQFNLLVLQMG